MPDKSPEQSVGAFLKACPLSRAYRAWSPADADRLADRLDPALILLAQRNGWAAYDRDALWQCDPDEWAGVAAQWINQRGGRLDVVFRTAFGDLVVWDGESVWMVLVHESAYFRIAASIQQAIGFVFHMSTSYLRKRLPPRMRRARAEAGVLEADEMYNFNPALALGGTETQSKMIKSKTLIALDIISQLAPAEELGFKSQ